ncbi:MAG: hypothetical protein V7661_06145 [Sulfitobacter sp.]
MAPIAIKKSENVLTVQINHSLSKDMISTLRAEIDGFIDLHDHAPNLVISRARQRRIGAVSARSRNTWLLPAAITTKYWFR